MRWEDERYVRVYVRDTVDWLALSWDAQSLFMHLLRKVDRAGLLPLGRHGKRAVAIAAGCPHLWQERIAPALEELLTDGCVVIQGDTLIIPNFLEAQETPQSDRQRKAESRARARELAAAGSVTSRPDESRNVTESHEPSVPVTSGHSVLCRAVPDRAVPNRAEEALSPASPPGPAPDSRNHESANSPPEKPPAAPQPSPRAEQQRQEEDEVFAYWQRVLGHPRAKLGKPDRKRIRARLEEGHSLEDLKRVVDGCAASDWHMGRDPKNLGKRFDSLELLFRDAGKVAEFMARAPEQGPPVEPVPDTPADRCWAGALERMRAEGAAYSAKQLADRLRPGGFRGERLLLLAQDQTALTYFLAPDFAFRDLLERALPLGWVLEVAEQGRGAA
jgi:uncharacterized phage protein (TIGR02220 family)